MDTALASAHKALDAGEQALALAHLLSAWRKARQAPLACLIERVGAIASRGAPKIDGPDAASRERAWAARAGSPSAADVGPLLASLLEGVKVSAVGDRVGLLGSLEPDPRVAARYVAMLEAPPFTASSHKPIWVEILRQLGDQHADPRTADALARLAPTYTRVFGETVMGRWMQSQLARLAASLDEALPPASPARAPLEAKAADLVARMEALVARYEAPPAARPAGPAGAADDEGKHLRAIADDPADGARRAAFEAWLRAKGDPRVELAALEARRKASGGALPTADEKREQALLKKHLASWLGPLAPVVLRPRFERGLLVECGLVPRGTKTGPAIGDPRWATVETLHCSYQKNYGREVIMHPVLRSLRRLTDAPDELVELLLNDPLVRPLEVLHCGRGPHPKILPATVSAPGLPHLRDLTVSCWYADSSYGATWKSPEVLRPFLQSPLAARLSVLRWSIHDSFIEALAAELDAHAPPRLTAPVDAYYLSLSRGPDGRYSHVDIRIESVEHELKYANSHLKTALLLDAGRPSKITVHAAPGADLSKLSADFAALKRRFSRAEIVLPPAAEALG